MCVSLRRKLVLSSMSKKGPDETCGRCYLSVMGGDHHVSVPRLAVDADGIHVGTGRKGDSRGEASRPIEAAPAQLSRLEEAAGVLGGDLAGAALAHHDGLDQRVRVRALHPVPCTLVGAALARHDGLNQWVGVRVRVRVKCEE